ncbi:MAG: exo-alpha-sialidase [Clostridia bacterium]|nr:exo-alpha-sialidase [Clostridia bacterium]
MLPSREQLIENGFPYGKADENIPLGNPQTEWMRTCPDRVLYLPHNTDGYDTDNCQLRVFENPKEKELLALWTQSSVEGAGDNRMVIARSKDGVLWSEPKVICGANTKNDFQASHAIQAVTESGRIYIFYMKETENYDNNRQESGALYAMYSDDGARTFSPAQEIKMPRSQYDNPDPAKNKNIVFWQPPIKDRNGRFITGATLYSSHSIYPPMPNWVNESAHLCMVRFENLDADPQIDEICLTWLPKDDKLIGVKNSVYPEMDTAEEPSLALLPDGRIFVTMRTMTGYAYYTVSSDDGETFSDPEILRFANGEPAEQPLAPCPIYRVGEAEYLFFFHNNPGKRMGFDEMDKRPWTSNLANYVRNPLYVSKGWFEKSSMQPVMLSHPVKLLDSGDVAVGPKMTAEVGTYTSICKWEGKWIFWYPDRKYYLLGKDVSEYINEQTGAV